MTYTTTGIMFRSASVFTLLMLIALAGAIKPETTGPTSATHWFVPDPDISQVLALHSSLHKIARSWPRMTRGLSDETLWCTAMKQSLPEIGLNGIMEAFRPLNYTPFAFDELLLENRSYHNPLHHLCHVVGAWAISLALPHGAEMDVMTVLGLPVSRMLFSGGFGAPLHGAIWQAMLESDATSASDLWAIAFGLCSFDNVSSDLVPMCLHGTGHGMMMSVLRGKLRTRNYTSCTSIPYGARWMSRSELMEAVQLCLAQGRANLADFCAGGLFDGYYQSITTFSNGVYLSDLTEELCGSIYHAVARSCFQFVQSPADCLHSSRIEINNVPSCLCVRTAQCVEVAYLPVPHQTKQRFWSACLLGPSSVSDSFELGLTHSALAEQFDDEYRRLGAQFNSTAHDHLRRAFVRAKLPVPNSLARDALARHDISSFC